MEQLRILERSSGAASGSGFNPYQECQAVHPYNGQRCQYRGAHNQHWAIYESQPGHTTFSQWMSAPSFAPPVMASGRAYPVWQKNLIKLAAVAAAGLVIWAAFQLLS